MTSVRPPITELPSARDPVEVLAESFLERYRQGERPSLSEYTALAPEHAEEILDLFPALVLMEQAQPGAAIAAGKATFERVGDYRIVREVGRGGMGIVFEAEQETLGRRVALKVLPAQASGSTSALLRFRREARSAARLHHTNIVPVFDVGERDGVHYYAMQFIQGQGLDDVIADLRRLSGRTSSDTERAAEAATQAAASPSPLSDAKSPSSAVFELSSTSTRGDGHLYRSAANIGLQAADAIAYAHGQRVLHRDIKPANLLLDARGTVWVTDFGLAKEEGDDLTRTGAIVGTARYMAPERFNGVSDASSDVYGLGMTLYELLTLRPAFDESDRARLVRAILHDEPPPPRSVDPHIPRDLETIVLKAIAKDPADRYETADELATDLRRFMADLPLLAQRVSARQRVGRWCRRNPGWAGTLGVVATLLIVMAVGGAMMNWRMRRTLDELQVANDEATDRLWQAHLERARALRRSGRVGQRFEALAAVREAAKIKITPELRDEAVGALVLPDVEIAQEWEGWPEGSARFAYSADLRTYARIDTQGALTVCRIAAHGEEVVARTRTDPPTHLHALRISPNGRYVVYHRPGDAAFGDGYVKIWRVADGNLTLCRELAEELSFQSVAFQSDSRRMAIGRRSGTVVLVELESIDLPRTLMVRALPMGIAFDPQGKRLAAACGASIRILDIESGDTIAELRREDITTWKYGVAWHPAGRMLAASSDSGRIHLWDIERGVEVATPLEGHTSSGITMAFNHRGDRLISNGWENQTRLWDVTSGQLLLTMPGGYGGAFGLDDTTMGMEITGTKLRIWRIADGRELRRLRRPQAERTEALLYAVPDADGYVAAAYSSRGLVFFDLHTGGVLGFCALEHSPMAHPRRYVPGGGWLTGGHQAAFWPARRDPDNPHTLHVGPPRRLASAVHHALDATPDGKYCVVPRGSHAVVLERDRPEVRVELSPHTDVRYCAISPDGNCAATFSWLSDVRFPAVRIWDARSGDHLIDLPVQRETSGAFSPDGRYLATFTPPDAHVWDTATWRRVRTFDISAACWVDFGSLLATNRGLGQISFYEPQTGEEKLRLTGPDSQIYSPIFVTADGTRFVSAVPDGRHLYLWDLELIGKQLRAMGFEWDWPQASPVEPKPNGMPVKRVEVHPGEWVTTRPGKSSGDWELLLNDLRDAIRKANSSKQDGDPAVAPPR